MIDIFGINELDDFIYDSLENKMIPLLYFGAEWCGPCKQLKQKLASKDNILEMPLLKVGHIDIDDLSNEEIVNMYNVNVLPTQIFIKVQNNKVIEVSRVEGYDYTKLKMEYNNYMV